MTATPHSIYSEAFANLRRAHQRLGDCLDIMQADPTAANIVAYERAIDALKDRQSAIGDIYTADMEARERAASITR